MDQPGGFLPNGVEAARAKLQPLIEQMLDDERAGTDLMRAYFHVYLNVRFIGQTNQLIAVFQDLLDAGCEYRDVFAGIVEAHKNLKRSSRWVHVLKDMQPDHVIVHDPNDPDGKAIAYAIVRPPRQMSMVRLRPGTYINEKAPEAPTEPEKATVTNEASSQDAVPE